MASIITEPICKTGERTLVPWRHGHKNKRHRWLMSVEIFSRVTESVWTTTTTTGLSWSEASSCSYLWKKTFLTNCEHIMFIQLRTIIFSNYCHYMSIRPSITRHQTPESSVDCYQPICKKTAFTDVSGRCLSDMCHQFLRSHIHELLARDIPAAICV